MLRGPWQPPGSAGGVAAVAIMAVPCSAAGHPSRHPLGHVPGSCATAHWLPFLLVPCSRGRPVRGMMATGASERTRHDVAQEGSCADDQDPEWRLPWAPPLWWWPDECCARGTALRRRARDHDRRVALTGAERAAALHRHIPAHSGRQPLRQTARHPPTRPLRSPGQRAGPWPDARRASSLRPVQADVRPDRRRRGATRLRAQTCALLPAPVARSTASWSSAPGLTPPPPLTYCDRSGG